MAHVTVLLPSSITYIKLVFNLVIFDSFYLLNSGTFKCLFPP